MSRPLGRSPYKSLCDYFFNLDYCYIHYRLSHLKRERGVVLLNKKELIVVSPRKCPNCKSGKKSVEGCDYKCPACGKGFCSKCYVMDPDGPGNYIYCPHCKEKLYFPKELLLKV